MKKILSLMLALMMLVLTFAACSSDTEGTGGNLSGVSGQENVNTYKPTENNPFNDVFEYDYVNGKEIVITGFSGSTVNHAVVIPSTIDVTIDKSTVSMPVTAIGEKAFYNQTGISELTIPEGVKTVGDFAFAKCVEMLKINVASTVESIGNAAFAECINLQTVTLPTPAGEDPATPVLGANAFYKCTSLTTVTLPSTLEEIKENTFWDCTSLTTVNMGAVKKIGEFAFSGCAKLNLTAVPATVTAIGNYAFTNCNPAVVDQLKASIPARATLGGPLEEIFGTTPVVEEN